MATRAVALKGPAYISASQSTYTDGTKFLIGDGLFLTAGHMAYEYNFAHSSQPSQIVAADIVSRTSTSDSYSIALDYRSYQSRYVSAVQSEYSSATSPHAKNEVIEARIIANDTVIITGSGTASSSSTGMAFFTLASDLASQATTLPGSSVTFEGVVSQKSGGTVVSASGGQLIYSIKDQLGDSGGVFLLQYGGTSYILGTLAGKSDTYNQSYGTYFTASDWSAINAKLVVGQTNNVTSSDPTNLIIGSAGNDVASSGTYRADIILGLAGNDILDGGDPVSSNTKAWANDQIFGGVGNDTIKGAYGSDLVHGGDRLSTASTDAQIAADGYDVADYSAITAVSPSIGVQIMIGGVDPVTSFTSGALASPDAARAIFVKDLGRQSDIDTLISIESVITTGADDRLVIGGLPAARLANSNHLGGLDKVDLGQGRDVVDASSMSSGLEIAMLKTDPYISRIGDSSYKVTVIGAESVLGSAAADVIRTDRDQLTLSGGAGADRITVSGSNNYIYGDDGDDLIEDAGFANYLYGGAGNDYIRITSTNTGSYIAPGAGSDLIDATARPYGQSNSAGSIVWIYNGDGHDKVIAKTADTYGVDDLDARSHWGIDSVQLKDAASSDTTVIWNPVVYRTQPGGGGVPDHYYARGDLAVKVNSTGDTIFFAGVFGDWSGGSTTNFASGSSISFNLVPIGFSSYGGPIAQAPGITMLHADVSAYDVSGPAPSSATRAMDVGAASAMSESTSDYDILWGTAGSSDSSSNPLLNSGAVLMTEAREFVLEHNLSSFPGVF